MYDTQHIYIYYLMYILASIIDVCIKAETLSGILIFNLMFKVYSLYSCFNQPEMPCIPDNSSL